jgi:hypothetical protein
MAFGTGTVLTNAGKAVTTNRIIGAGTEPNYVAAGVGATGAARTASIADTALSSELAEGRVSGTSSRVTTSVSSDTYQVIGTVTATGTRAIDEAGLFDASSSGNMYLSATFPVVNLSVNDSIQLTLKVQYS